MKVSVIIAAYNVADFIDRAIASVQAQTYGNWEVIVVDDASTDRTSEVVDRLGQHDARIRLVRREANGGPAAARNSGLDAATGEWIAVLDADDAWRPERLETMLSAAAVNDAEFVADNHIFYDAELQREVGVAHQLPQAIKQLTTEDLFMVEKAMRYGEMKPLIRRRSITECGLRYDPALRFGEDFKFYAELLINGVRAILIAEPLYVYTTPIGFVSNKKSAGTRTVDRGVAVLASSADALLAKYRDRLPPSLAERIRAYRKWIHATWVMRELTRMRSERKMLSLAVFVLAHPVVSARYAAKSRTFHTFKKVFAP
jgi:succinoglycan biosynthesis protein ExoO